MSTFIPPKGRPELTEDEARAAVQARLCGEFDNPALMKFGTLGRFASDVAEIRACVRPKLVTETRPKVTDRHRALARSISIWIRQDDVHDDFVAAQIAESESLRDEEWKELLLVKNLGLSEAIGVEEVTRDGYLSNGNGRMASACETHLKRLRGYLAKNLP